MEGSCRRRKAIVSSRREFSGSRLDREILVRAFDLVLPAQRLVQMPVAQPTADAVRPQVHPRRS